MCINTKQVRQFSLVISLSSFDKFHPQLKVLLHISSCLPPCQIYFSSLGPRSTEHQSSFSKHHHVEQREKPEGRSHKDKRSWVVEVEGTNTSKEVDGLRWYWHYELSVTAFNSKGEGPHSPSRRFETPEGGEFNIKGGIMANNKT